MQLKTTILWGVLNCLVLASIQVTANKQDDTEYRYVSFDDIKLAKKVDLTFEQEKLIEAFVLKQHGAFFNYSNYGTYVVNDRFVYVKLYLTIKGNMGRKWREYQRQRLNKGMQPANSMFYDFTVIDTEEAKAFSLGINYIPEDGILRFHFGSCLSERFAFEQDINQDGKNELFFIRGYESGFDFFNTSFNQYKLYMLADYDSLLFQEWVTNIDHGTVPQDIPISEYKKPNITGLAGTAIDPFYTIKYDGYDDLIKDDKSGLKRFNSQFYFDYIDKEEKGISKQLVLVWSKVYRPSPDPKSRDFVMTEERYKWYEGDVTAKTAFVEKPVTEEDFKAFLTDYKLSFDDGLTGERLCNLK